MNRIPVQIILSVVSQIHAADDVHQRGFSGAGGAQDGDKFPLSHLEADVLQDGYLLIPKHIALIDVVHVYDQFPVDFHIFLHTMPKRFALSAYAAGSSDYSTIHIFRMLSVPASVSTAITSPADSLEKVVVTPREVITSVPTGICHDFVSPVSV